MQSLEDIDNRILARMYKLVGIAVFLVISSATASDLSNAAASSLASNPEGSGSALTVVSFGGAYQAAQRKAYMGPFQKVTGIRITESDYNGDYALLRLRASATRPTWDVVSIEAAVCARATKEGVLAPIDYAKVPRENFLPGAARSHCAGHLVFSTVLAYSSRAYRDPNSAPKDWRDFFDLSRFPGKRGLRNNPRGSLEIALLGSGISPDKLYPLDVDKAFKALDRIKSQLEFWESGAQPVQMLTRGTVVMSSAYNGRIWDASNKEHLPVAWSWGQGLMEIEYWGVLRNSINKETAMQFIGFSLTPMAQATFANEIAYGPTNLAALPSVHEAILEAIPNSNSARPLQVPVDPEWWAEHEQEVSARWQTWVSQRD